MPAPPASKGKKPKQDPPTTRRRISSDTSGSGTEITKKKIEVLKPPSSQVDLHQKDGTNQCGSKRTKQVLRVRKDLLKGSPEVRTDLVIESSEDFTDSDFEPQNSQRLKPVMKRKPKKSFKPPKTSSNEEPGPSNNNLDKIKSDVPSSSSPKNKGWVLLDSHAEDIECDAKVLIGQMRKFRQRYLDQSWDPNMLAIATKELNRHVKTAVHSLLSVSESLESLSSTSFGQLPHDELNMSRNNERKKTQQTGLLDGTVLVEDSDDNVSEHSPRRHDTLVTSNLKVDCENKRSGDHNRESDVKLQRCGSTESEGGEDPASVDGEEKDVEKMLLPSSNTQEPLPTPCDDNELANNLSSDLFDDNDGDNYGHSYRLGNEPNGRGNTDEIEEKVPATLNNNCNSDIQPTIIQSSKSLACKSYLMASSSDSDDDQSNGAVIGSPHGSVSNFSAKSKRNSDFDVDSDFLDQHERNFNNKKNFNIKNLEVYRCDKKLQGKCFVEIQKLDCEEERRHFDVVGDYYDSSKQSGADSDRSVDNLINLGNLKRKAKDEEENSEDSLTDKDTKQKREGKPSKSNGKETEKLADFLNKSNDEISELEPASENVDACSKDSEKTDNPLNEAQKRLLLQSSDSEEIQSASENDDGQGETNKKLTTGGLKTETTDVEKSESKYDTEKESVEENTVDLDSDEPTSKEKNKDWRKNKLLCGKLSDTDTSDDERRRMKKAKNPVEGDSSDDTINPKQTRKSKSFSKSNADSDAIVVSDGYSSSTSEDFVKKKRKVIKKSSSSSSESDRPKKKRRRIKIARSSSSSNDEASNKNAESPTKGRKKIKHMIQDDDLEEGTKEAAKVEGERLKRIAARQKMYEELYDNVQKGFDVLDQLILDFDEKTKKPLVEVDKILVKKLKPHQAKGVKFMWDACFESLKHINKNKGTGCILAHCMGLGKTFQVVTLVHTLFKFPETKVHTVLVVCPVSTVLNWVNEFDKWLKDVTDGPSVEVYELIRLKQNPDRSYCLRQWQEDGGVMVMGYDMYRNLTNPTTKKFRSTIMKSFQATLVDPGPDLIICDEGHLLKNEDTGTSKAMTRIKTSRRIVLTGTPLQNNLKEYHCMVQFIKPNLLGSRKEFLNRFVNPITNGQFEDSTTHDVRRMKRRAHVLHKTLEGCVQRFDYSVLTPFLPPKEEYVVSVRLSEIQEKLYRHYLDNYSSRGYQGKGAQLFADFQQLQRIWTHPRVLKMSAERNELKAEKEEEDSEGSLRDFIDDGSCDSDTSSSSDVVCLSDGSNQDSKQSKDKPSRRTRSNKNPPSDPEPEPPKKGEWWEDFIQETDLEDLRASPKLVLLFSILKDCEENGEKLLIFSQSLFSLDLIEYFLSKIDEANQKGVKEDLLDGHQSCWSFGIDYFRLDGSTPTDLRNTWCNIFNRPSNLRARLFLISTRAGGLGINLVAANRVVVFDASWNPSHDVQSIFRVYRFGQKKPCFIYRFLAQGTMEEKIYERQVTKLSLACRVVDEQQIGRYYKMSDLQELYCFTPADRATHIMPKLPKDHLFAEVLKRHDTIITKYHEHDSLLENKEEEELNEEERKAAWEDYENEKKGPPPGGFNNAVAQLPSLEQLEEMIRMKHPEKSEDDVKASAAALYRQAVAQQREDIRVKQLQYQQQYQLQQMQIFQQQQQQQQLLQQYRQQQYNQAMQQQLQPLQYHMTQAMQNVLRASQLPGANMLPSHSISSHPLQAQQQTSNLNIAPSTSAGPSRQQGNQSVDSDQQRQLLLNPYNSRLHKEP